MKRNKERKIILRRHVPSRLREEGNACKDGTPQIGINFEANRRILKTIKNVLYSMKRRKKSRGAHVYLYPNVSANALTARLILQGAVNGVLMILSLEILANAPLGGVFVWEKMRLAATCVAEPEELRKRLPE